ncbi:MAG: FHA domain-containing protein [Chthoniobacterales bacterium]
MRLTVYFPEDSPTTHECVGEMLTIGRLGDNDVALDEASVSSRHAEIVAQDGAVVLRDLDSTNGTFLNGEQITGEHPLEEGDEIYFGGVRTVFMEPAGLPVSVASVAEAPMESAGFAAAQTGTGRPDDFRYMSPLPRPEKPKDTLGLVAWACAGLGALAAVYALFAIFTA